MASLPLLSNTTDYPKRIVVLLAPFLTGSAHRESKDLSPTFYTEGIEVRPPPLPRLRLLPFILSPRFRNSG